MSMPDPQADPSWLLMPALSDDDCDGEESRAALAPMGAAEAVGPYFRAFED